MRRRLLTCLAATLALAPAAGRSADDPKPTPPAGVAGAAVLQAPARKPGYTPEDEARVMGLVRRELPELAGLLEPLKAAGRDEYHQAIGGLAAETRILEESRAKNPKRYPLALDSWKARTRVDMIAAMLARSPSPGREAQLRSAIEARVEADIRRQRFDLEQAEANVARLRENLARAEAGRDRARVALDRIEKNRASQVDSRFQALRRKPAAQSRSKADPAPGKTAVPMPTPVSTPPDPVVPVAPMPAPKLSSHVVPMPSPAVSTEGNR